MITKFRKGLSSEFNKTLESFSKKMYTKDEIDKILGVFSKKMDTKLNNILVNILEKDSLFKTIETQNKIINDLINNIYLQDSSLETVVIKPYRGAPKIFKDGKRLDTDDMTRCNIDWSYDKKIEISITNE